MPEYCAWKDNLILANGAVLFCYSQTTFSIYSRCQTDYSRYWRQYAFQIFRYIKQSHKVFSKKMYAALGDFIVDVIAGYDKLSIL